MVIKKGGLLGKPLGMRPIVTVQKRQILTARELNTFIAGRRHTEIGIITRQANARIAIRQDNVYASVDRSVIDNEQFEIRKCLRQYAVDRDTHVLFPIINGNYDSDFRESSHGKDPAFAALTILSVRVTTLASGAIPMSIRTRCAISSTSRNPALLVGLTLEPKN